MKRNMDLIRKLAIHIEAAEDSIQSSGIVIEEFSSSAILYLCVLMHEAGLIEAEIAGDLSGHGDAFIARLTWSGHDFLDAARDETLWKKTTKEIKERVTSVSFDGLVDFLKAGAKIAMSEAIGMLP